MGVDDLLQVLTLDQAHGDEQVPTGLAGAVDRDDVGMVEIGRRASLPHEPLAIGAVVDGAGGDHLQRDATVLGDLVRFVHARHAAARDQPFEPEVADEALRLLRPVG